MNGGQPPPAFRGFSYSLSRLLLGRASFSYPPEFECANRLLDEQSVDQFADQKPPTLRFLNIPAQPLYDPQDYRPDSSRLFQLQG